MDISGISVSRTGVWTECHQRYKYQYHLKIPSPEPEPAYFEYGKIIHKIIEVFTENKGKLEIGKVAQDVLTGVIPIEDDGRKAKNLPLEYKQKLPDHLRSFMKLTERIGTEGLIEWPFEYDMLPPEGAIVRGFIDRIIIKGDEYFLIDYKTSKKGGFRKNAKTITSDLQLQTYCRVVQKKFGADPKKIKAALFYLDGGNLVAASFSEKTLEAAEQYLIKVYKDIKNSDPDAVQGNVGRHCVRCDYRKVCPFYKLTEN